MVAKTKLEVSCQKFVIIEICNNKINEIFMKKLGTLLQILAIVDFAGMFFGYDLTGQSWTPIAFGFAGAVLSLLGKSNDEETNNN